MILPRSILFGFLFLLASVAGAQNQPPVDKMPAITPPGKQTYLHYCASCHGVDARGDGPVAHILKTPPADLTTLAKRHDGKFPYDYVSGVLRFGTRFTAHGSSDMPVWGPVFGSLDDQNLRKRIKELSDYLASLQQKES
jgi:mono/diheme cytochrome c family protein